jgi:hypothetical protein
MSKKNPAGKSGAFGLESESLSECPITAIMPDFWISGVAFGSGTYLR